MRKWLPLLAVCLGTFMLLIDVTIVNVALPDMAKDLSLSLTSMQWVVDGYALTLAALVLGAGSIADLIGHRSTYVVGLVVFAVSSLCCGVAPNDGVLVAARLVQGVGAAAMFATTFALLNASYQGRDRGTAYGLWGAVSGAAAAVGPILGGILTEGINWRWIFFVNLPISVLAIAMCLRVFTADRPRGGSIDVTGMVAFTAAAGALTYGLIHANESGWGDAASWSLIVAGVALLGLFVAVEARSEHAMLDLGLLRNRSFVGLLAGGLLLTFAAFAYFTYTSIWLQSVLGLSPIAAGLTGLPMSAAAFITSAALGRVLHQAQPGRVIGGGLILIGLGGLVSMALVRGGASWPALLPGFAVVGVGVGLSVPILGSAGMAAVPVHRGGMAAGAINTARQLGFAFGIAVLGSVFASRAASHLAGAGVPSSASVAHGLAGGQAQGILAGVGPDRAHLEQLLRSASIAGLDATFLVAGVSGLLAGLLVLALVRPRPSTPVPARATDAAPAATG